MRFGSYQTFLPIWPILHFGDATILPPIQKNSSAKRDIADFCHSLGEVIIEGEGDLKGEGDLPPGLEGHLLRDGENKTGDDGAIPEDVFITAGLFCGHNLDLWSCPSPTVLVL